MPPKRGKRGHARRKGTVPSTATGQPAEPNSSATTTENVDTTDIDQAGNASVDGTTSDRTAVTDQPPGTNEDAVTDQPVRTTEDAVTDQGVETVEEATALESRSATGSSQSDNANVGPSNGVSIDVPVDTDQENPETTGLGQVSSDVAVPPVTDVIEEPMSAEASLGATATANVPFAALVQVKEETLRAATGNASLEANIMEANSSQGNPEATGLGQFVNVDVIPPVTDLIEEPKTAEANSGATSTANVATAALVQVKEEILRAATATASESLERTSSGTIAGAQSDPDFPFDGINIFSLLNSYTWDTKKELGNAAARRLFYRYFADNVREANLDPTKHDFFAEGLFDQLHEWYRTLRFRDFMVEKAAFVAGRSTPWWQMRFVFFFPKSSVHFTEWDFPAQEFRDKLLKFYKLRFLATADDHDNMEASIDNYPTIAILGRWASGTMPKSFFTGKLPKPDYEIIGALTYVLDRLSMSTDPINAQILWFATGNKLLDSKNKKKKSARCGLAKGLVCFCSIYFVSALPVSFSMFIWPSNKNLVQDNCQNSLFIFSASQWKNKPFHFIIGLVLKN